MVHYKVALHVLQYLKSVYGTCLSYSATANLLLSRFADFDWATCPISRKSVTSYAVFLGTSLISWKSKKQSRISRSNSEVEYQTLATLACDIQWLYLFKDFDIPFSNPTSVYYDNNCILSITTTPFIRGRNTLK